MAGIEVDDEEGITIVFVIGVARIAVVPDDVTIVIICMKMEYDGPYLDLLTPSVLVKRDVLKYPGVDGVGELP